MPPRRKKSYDLQNVQYMTSDAKLPIAVQIRVICNANLHERRR